jgi:molybdenum cofactor cytidylyltransferase
LKGLAGLVLAAGASTRMGTPKQLLPVAQSTLLDRVLSEALTSDLGLVVLVLGFKAREIVEGLRTDLRHPKLKIVENKDPGRGISSSIITGLSVVEKNWDGVMIILADMPHVTAGLINLLKARSEESGCPLAALTLRGKRSHPVIIRRPFFPALRALRGDEGARTLFVEHAEQVCLVEPEGDYDDRDIDTRDDYLALKKKLEST